MEATTSTSLVHKVRGAVLLHDGAGLSDGRLLDLFIDHRDDIAFAALVRQHGPMVWSVCRRLLDRQDAEDAFQATFLVLVRKAATVLPREQVGNWLYGAARQTALQARRITARRRGRERQVAEMPEPATSEDAVWRDLRPLLDRELSRLPDRYRTVIVLCDLEGNTRKEAARQLGVPEGSVSGWLARGRAMLAKRLARQGVALSAGALATVLGRAAAGPPPSVVGFTIKAASVSAAGQAATTGLISAKVAALTEGVLKTMMMSKIKAVTAVLLAVVCLGGTVVFLPPAVGQPPAAEKKGGGTKATAGEHQRQETGKTKLQGGWEIMSIECEGTVVKKDELANWKNDLFQGMMTDWTVEGHRMWAAKADEIKSRWSGSFVLGDTRNAKDVNIHLEEPNGKMTFRGIYSIEGDTLKVCINMHPNDVCRPEEFVTRKESPVLIATFKKVPPRK
ncbi:MAG TPA: sigma-70 family RNA polymerase sigma factor [Urbifossiella sp.]|jgi:RNA polymerase sigma factor (sigma-70 family)|nr:sigma-70 family RNA polymerase sigma factor [Urbifossiella sp.]